VTVLRIETLTKRFGGVTAVDNLSLSVNEREILGLIGPNGSGKSTTINLICGLFPADSGTIHLNNKPLKNKSINQRSNAGIGRTFQNIRLFDDLTVWQNLWVSLRNNISYNKVLKQMFSNSEEDKIQLEELLAFCDLHKKSELLASHLSFGEQRRLELARALASKPKLLLLDEPAAGMNSKEVKELRDRILLIREKGVTVLLVEHVMDLVMSVTDRITVLNFGKKIAEGSPDEIQKNKVVQQAYFGSN